MEENNTQPETSTVQQSEAVAVATTTATESTPKHKSFWDFQLNLLKSIFTNWDFKRRIWSVEYQYILVTLLILQFLVVFLGNDISSLFGIFSLVVSIKIWIGRMKDLGWSPWLLLLMLLPIVNFFVLLLLLFKRGTKWPNKHGADVHNNYKKAWGVKRYYGLIQILIFLGLWLILFLPLIAFFSLFIWWISQLPMSEMMEQVQQLTGNFNVNFSWNEVFMSWSMGGMSWNVSWSAFPRTGF